MSTRTATVTGHWPSKLDAERAVAAYLPDNYQIIGTRHLLHMDPQRPDRIEVMIKGEDKAGWTLDDYVIPRLASGMYGCKETRRTDVEE